MYKIYENAINEFGIGNQLLKAIQECSGLITALTHYLEDRPGSIEEIIEETADVEIMCSQLRCMAGSKNVDKHKNSKLYRLKVIIAKERVKKQSKQ